MYHFTKVKYFSSRFIYKQTSVTLRSRLVSPWKELAGNPYYPKRNLMTFAFAFAIFESFCSLVYILLANKFNKLSCPGFFLLSLSIVFYHQMMIQVVRDFNIRVLQNVRISNVQKISLSIRPCIHIGMK